MNSSAEGLGHPQVGYNAASRSPSGAYPMDKGLELLSSETYVPLRADPRLRLLWEPEPAHWVFLRNLIDLVLLRNVPRVKTTSPPGRFWSDVFIKESVPWGAFAESLAYHGIAVALYCGLVSIDARRPQVTQRAARAESHIIYYPTSKAAAASDPALSSRAEARKEAARAAKQRAMPVTPEKRREGPALVTPPDIIAAARPTELPAYHPAPPAVPLDATGRPRNLPAGPNSVVAPPPELTQAGKGTKGLLQGSVVAPPPDAGAVSGRRGTSGPNLAVVAPPPSVSGVAQGRGGLGTGPSQVIGPAPDVNGRYSGGGARSANGPGSPVVPPPPSVSTELHGNGFGRAAGSRVVPPPPSVQGSGSGGGRRVSSAPGSGPDIVPPPPSVQGNSNGNGMHSIPGSGPGVVPPPPSLRAGDSPGGSGTRPPAGLGSQIVPPPPSVGTGNRRGGGGGMLSGIGGAVVPPAPSVQASGRFAGSGGSGVAGVVTGVVPPPPSLSGGANGTGAGEHGGALRGAGTRVVPPPVSIGTGSRMGGRVNGLGGGGAEVVPPPPSVGDAAGVSGRRGAALASGSPVVPPAPSLSGAGVSSGSNGRAGALAGAAPEAVTSPLSGLGSTSTGPLEQMDPLDTSPQPPPPPFHAPEPPGEDIPFRLVSLALGTPGSSFFSNYEVFIAERRFGKAKAELVKLVYTFLPYQKRLSEYFRDNRRVYTLRVLRDPSCDETLMQMTWPEGSQPPSEALGSKDHAPTNGDQSPRLPCFRTSADDYMRALERSRR